MLWRGEGGWAGDLRGTGLFQGRDGDIQGVQGGRVTSLEKVDVRLSRVEVGDEVRMLFGVL